MPVARPQNKLGTAGYDSAMPDQYKLVLTSHQARGLNVALALVNQLLAIPPNTPVYPNLMTEGVERPLIVDEFKLLHEAIRNQLEEQDRQ